MKRFSNAGDKIQTFAIIIAIAGSLLIIALYMYVLNEAPDLIGLKDDLYSLNKDSLIGRVIQSFKSDEIVLAFCTIKDMLTLWFWMLLLYAFGELCENVYELNHSSRVTFYDDYERYKKNPNGTPLEKALTGNQKLDFQQVWQCPNCSKTNLNSSDTCVDCGFRR